MFKSKLTSSVAFLFVCLIFPLVGWGGTAGTTVTINATVDTFAEWGSAPYTIAAGDWAQHITAVNQSVVLSAATKDLTLYANANVTVTMADAGTSGILTNGTDTLTTEYKVTGADIKLADRDADYISAAAFLAKSYRIDHVAGDGAYTFPLAVRMTSPNNRAPNAGNYQCVLTMTATW